MSFRTTSVKSGVRTDLDAVSLFREIEAARKEAGMNALREGALRGLPDVKAETPIDMGHARASWQVIIRHGEKEQVAGRVGEVSAELYNGWPMIDVLERGRRPGPISRAGIEAVADWARRKLGKSEMDARAVAYGYAKKVKERGVPATYRFRKLRPKLLELCVAAHDAALQRALPK